MTKLSASLMCANPLNLQKDLAALENGGIDLFHIDIMDGVFVPNIAMNFDVLRDINSVSSIPLDLHLMMQNPESYLEKAVGLNVSHLSFHAEAVRSPIRLLRKIRSLGIKAGIAYNPTTSLSGLEFFINELDFVLIMSVEAGFAGQSFIPSAYDKIAAVRKLSKTIEIMVDGSINPDTAKECIKSGADILVCGTSSVFKKGADLSESCLDFREKITI